MKSKSFLLSLLVSALMLTALSSCEDDLNKIGPILSSQEVSIAIDSVGFNITGQSLETPVIDARTVTNMLGRISVPEYGDLKCSFVSRLMCASSMNVNDTVVSDSVAGMKMIMQIPRGTVTGDSLAPQQLKVFRLTKPLPDSITNQFNPTGYYDPSSPYGSYNFTYSNIGHGDSTFYKSTSLKIPVSLPKEFAVDVFNKYRNDSTTFAWPSSFAKYFHGIYVESSFGRGCVANISDISFYLYYKYGKYVYVKEDSVSVAKRVSAIDSIPLFSTSPIVLSSNNIYLKVSDNIKNLISNGNIVIQSPAGYNAELKFPAQEIIDRYNSEKKNISVINELSFFLPVKIIENDHGINPPPYLMIIKKDEYAEFFKNNKIPDNLSSFWASYSSVDKGYTFASMRDYLNNIIKEGKDISEKDTDFLVIPVEIEMETSSSSAASYVKSCTPYLSKPTMCILDVDNAKIKLTYSNQELF